MSWVAVGATAVGAGASLYSSSKNSKAIKKAGQQNIGDDIRSYIDAMQDSLPSLLKSEKKFRKKFQKANLKEFQSFLQGGKGQKGLFDLSRMSTRNADDLLQQARRRDLETMTQQSGRTRGLLDAISPEGAAQVQAATQMAEQARLSAQGLTPQEERSAQQFAREGSGARGRLMDNSSLANELLNRDSVLAGKRQEAYQATNNAANLAGSFYSTPGLGLLTSTPQSYQAGQGLLGISLGSLGSATPQLINPDTGANLGAANNQNQLAAASAAAQSNSANLNSWLTAGSNVYSSHLRGR